jgi:hypothetical protein
VAKPNVIRDLFVQLGIVIKPGSKKDLDKFDKQIEATKQGLEDLASLALRVGAAVVGAGIALATAAGIVAVQTGEQAEAIERQARALGLTRKEYQELLFVFQSFGASDQDMADTLLQINDAAQRAIGGSKEMTENFQAVGVSMADLKGKDPGELFELMADSLSTATDKAKAMSVMSQLLGEESGRKLGPALMEGGDAIRAMRMEASALGVVMRDDQLRVAKQVSVEWRRLKMVAKGLRNELGVALAPMVTKVFRGMFEWVRANRELLSQRITDWVHRLEAAIAFLNASVRLIGGWDQVFMAVATGTGLLLFLANLSKILDTIEAIRLVLPVLRAGAVAAGAAIGAPFIPVAIVVAGLLGALILLGLAVDDVVTHFRGGQSVLGGWLDIIDAAIPAFGVWRDMWWSVAMAFLQGFTNLGMFIGALLEGLKPALELVNIVLDPLLAGMQALLDLWLRLNALASAPMQWATTQLQSYTAASGNNAGVMAGQIQRQVAGSVQSQVDDARLRSAVALAGATNNVTQSQQIQFNGFGASAHDVQRAMESENRKAAVAVREGVR